MCFPCTHAVHCLLSSEPSCAVLSTASLLSPPAEGQFPSGTLPQDEASLPHSVLFTSSLSGGHLTETALGGRVCAGSMQGSRGSQSGLLLQQQVHRQLVIPHNPSESANTGPLKQASVTVYTACLPVTCFFQVPPPKRFHNFQK